MIIQPKVRGFICTTAHPRGCAQHVQHQIQYVLQRAPLKRGPKKVLIIGASTGYGLASRIVAAFGAQASTFGVSFEKPAEGKRTASAGWYNTAAFEAAAHQKGLYAKSLNGDAFSDTLKTDTIQQLAQDWQGGIDLVIYSLAAPRRLHPKTGQLSHATLKPIHTPLTSKTVDPLSGQVSDITLPPATEEEIQQTIAVMGGEDWAAWIEVLLQAELLAEEAITVAYSYIGPPLTYAIYRDGTIGQAKAHLETTAKQLETRLSTIKGKAWVSVNKALVTQASAAIPIVPLYISLLYRVMKEKNCHETCIAQMWRLFQDRLYTSSRVPTDPNGRIRLDDYEMQEDVQETIKKLWPQITSENVMTITDLEGYREAFYQLFGFHMPEVDYTQETEAEIAIPSLLEKTLS